MQKWTSLNRDKRWPEVPAMDYAEFIGPDNERWASILEKTKHDFYHLPGYVTLQGEHESARPVAFYAECGDSAMLVPLLIRSLPPRLHAPAHWCDVASPYGFPSPLFYSPSGACSPGKWLKALNEASLAIDAVCGFLRLHPLLPAPKEGLVQQGELISHGQTVVIDLQKSEEQVWRGTRKNHRDDILRLKREGFSAVMDDWSRWYDFINAYHATMSRLQANSHYCFSTDYFEKFRAVLGSHLHLCSILSPDGEVAASGLIIVIDGLVQFHLAATASPYLCKAPSKLMFDAVRQWAQKQGGDFLHLGGGVGGRNDSLFRFKAGFSDGRADFYTFRMIFDRDRYDQLVRQWRESGATAEEEDDFFPLYRK